MHCTAQHSGCAKQALQVRRGVGGPGRSCVSVPFSFGEHFQPHPRFSYVRHSPSRKRRSGLRTPARLAARSMLTERSDGRPRFPKGSGLPPSHYLCSMPAPGLLLPFRLSSNRITGRCLRQTPRLRRRRSNVCAIAATDTASTDSASAISRVYSCMIQKLKVFVSLQSEMGFPAPSENAIWPWHEI